MDLYPFRFQPIFQQYLWGGRRLETDLNKPIGPGETYAESWEVVDHGSVQSVVQNGPLCGTTLTELVSGHAVQLLGERTATEIARMSRPANLRNRFPLLFKFLDANKNLSVQVHPDDQMAATLSEPDLGKTEAWYVLEASPGAKVYAGLKAGVTRAELQKAIGLNQAETLLHCFEPQRGDCLFIPAGTVHALGAGLLIAEIQQCSNTTFRLYDWGRVDQDGNARELHVEQGLAATSYSQGPVSPQAPSRLDDQVERLVDCDKFKLDRVTLSSNRSFETSGEFKMIAMLSGEMSLDRDPAAEPMRKGDTCLIPASEDLINISFGPNSQNTQADFLLVSPG